MELTREMFIVNGACAPGLAWYDSLNITDAAALAQVVLDSDDLIVQNYGIWGSLYPMTLPLIYDYVNYGLSQCLPIYQLVYPNNVAIPTLFAALTDYIAAGTSGDMSMIGTALTAAAAERDAVIGDAITGAMHSAAVTFAKIINQFASDIIAETNPMVKPAHAYFSNMLGIMITTDMANDSALTLSSARLAAYKKIIAYAKTIFETN